MRGPLSRNRWAVHLIPVLRGGRRIDGDDAWSAIPGSIAIQNRRVGLAVDVGDFTIRAYNKHHIMKEKGHNQMIAYRIETQKKRNL